jgi:hypothetical protein
VLGKTQEQIEICLLEVVVVTLVNLDDVADWDDHLVEICIVCCVTGAHRHFSNDYRSYVSKVMPFYEEENQHFKDRYR